MTDTYRKGRGEADLDSVDTCIKYIRPIPKEKVVRAHADGGHNQGVCGTPVPGLAHHVLCLWIDCLDGFRPNWVVQFILRCLPDGMHQMYECLGEGGLQLLTVSTRKGLRKVHHKFSRLLECLRWPHLSRTVNVHAVL